MSSAVPQEWLPTQLGSISEHITKGATPTTYGYEWEESGIYFLRSECVKPYRLSPSGAAFISDDAHLAMKRSVVREGDILISITGYIGAACILPKGLGEANINQHIARIRVESEETASFIMYYLNSEPMQKEFQLIQTGQAYPQLSLKQLHDTVVPLPPLPEQKKIASILTSVDEVIENTESQIAKLQDLKSGIMQELLTQGIGHTEFKDSPVGMIPVGWDTSRLVDLSINGISNGVFKDPKNVGSGYRLINVLDMYQGFGVNLDKVELLTVSEKEFVRNKVEYGDVFFTRSSLKLEGIAFCNINLSARDDITFEGHLMRIRPDTARILPKYLAYYCLSDYARKYFMSVAKHSTMTTIGQQDIAPLNVSLPSLDEQQAIISSVDSIASKIDATSKKLISLRNIKRSLMQDLLTGKVRVSLEQP
jgi:type I restriction enzyme, S subunit